jgi:hypothetical protein
MYIGIIDRMNTDYRGFLEAPLSVVFDYLTVMAGEARRAQPGMDGRSEGDPPGFEMETFEEWV